MKLILLFFVFIINAIKEKCRYVIDEVIPNHITATAIISVVLGVLLIFGFVVGIFAIFVGFPSEEEKAFYQRQAERDEYMASQDWGDGYYYDTDEHEVKEYNFP